MQSAAQDGEAQDPSHSMMVPISQSKFVESERKHEATRSENTSSRRQERDAIPSVQACGPSPCGDGITQLGPRGRDSKGESVVVPLDSVLPHKSEPCKGGEGSRTPVHCAASLHASCSKTHVENRANSEVHRHRDEAPLGGGAASYAALDEVDGIQRGESNSMGEVHDRDDAVEPLGAELPSDDSASGDRPQRGSSADPVPMKPRDDLLFC